MAHSPNAGGARFYQPSSPPQQEYGGYAHQGQVYPSQGQYPPQPGQQQYSPQGGQYPPQQYGGYPPSQQYAGSPPPVPPKQEHFSPNTYSPKPGTHPTTAQVVNEGAKPGPEVVGGIPLYGEQLPGDDGKHFVVQGARDVWAAVLFVVVMLGTAIWGGVQMSQSKSKEQNDVANDSAKYIPLSLGASVILCVAAMILMRCAPLQYIYAACVASVVLSVATAIMIFAAGQYVVGALCLVGAIFTGLWFWWSRHLMPFAAVLLKTASTLTIRYWGTVVTGMLSLLVSAAFFALWAMAVVPLLGNLEEDQYQSGGSFALYFLALLILFWWVQVAANVVHVTASGVTATWFFVGDDRTPSSPTPANLKRAMTTSFGSICFGSLVVAFLKTVYYMLRQAINSIHNEIARCILSCMVGCLERMTEFFNVYAFTYVAIYGSDFITAAKQCWNLVKTCTWPVLINDSIIWTVLGITDFFLCLFVGAIFGLIAKSAAIGMLAAIMCLAVTTVFLRPIYSSVAAQFVCCAENSHVIGQVNPAYWAELQATMPSMDTNPGNRGQQYQA